VSPNGLAFSPDGSHFAYVEGQSNRAVVVDGVQRVPAMFAHQPDDVPAEFVFSQDGKHPAFAPDAMGTYDITFTPDGKHLMWLGGRGENRLRVYVDGEPVPESDQPATSRQSVETWWNMGADGVLTPFSDSLVDRRSRRYRTRLPSASHTWTGSSSSSTPRLGVRAS